MKLNTAIALIIIISFILAAGCGEDNPAGAGAEDGETLSIHQQADTNSYVGDTLTIHARATESDGDSIYFEMELIPDVQTGQPDTDFDPVTGEFIFYPAAGDKPFQDFIFRVFDTSGDQDSTTFRVNVSDSPSPPEGSMIIDHTCCDIYAIPREAIQGAIDNLVIAYGHTSHGSQLVTGMDSLAAFLGDGLYNYSSTGADNTLRLIDRPFGVPDLGNPDGSSWESATRTYLDANPDVNVVIWSWCGQVADASESYIDNYLSLMTGLENDYPDVDFVYMTGHLIGASTGNNIFVRNQQIRDYCINNDRILYDFADIESYDPDGIYYADKLADDNCDYDSDNDGYQDANWATEWQNAHPGEWYQCIAAHTQPLNANLKAYAAWHLWARLGGWDGSSD